MRGPRLGQVLVASQDRRRRIPLSQRRLVFRRRTRAQGEATAAIFQLIAEQEEPKALLQARPLLLPDGAKPAENECALLHRDEWSALQVDRRDAAGISCLWILAREVKRDSEEDGGGLSPGALQTECTGPLLVAEVRLKSRSVAFRGSEVNATRTFSSLSFGLFSLFTTQVILGVALAQAHPGNFAQHLLFLQREQRILLRPILTSTPLLCSRMRLHRHMV